MSEKKYLIDTNIYANYLKKNQHQQINQFIKGLNEDEFLVSSFVLLELFTFYRNSPEGVKQPTLELLKRIHKGQIVHFNLDDLSVALDVRTQL